ncbi:MAG TPA: zinc-dependent metalloprotease [Beutenbergiaceae bacterium]|nr:zinc-dependent metalloprotease [Beutenbergiaceae bacterium]
MSAASTPARAAVDWDLAVKRARSLVRSGPRTDRAEAALLVESLRSGAVRAPEFVGEVTQLPEAAEQAGQRPVHVIDRPRWIEGNVAMFAHLLGDLLPAPKSAGGPRLAGEELGVVLPLLASRVLGQYDPYTPAPQGPGRLVLVAPNVLHVQRELGLDGPDFHLWVCLHEQTHALQFTAAPWLAEHLQGLLRQLMGTLLREEDSGDRLRDLLGALPRAITGETKEPDSAGPLLGAVLSEQEQDLMDQTVAIMSLLEGHADVVMDEVGPQVVPSVATIRSAFDRRRANPGPMEAVLRRLLGMDAKLAQYRQGAAFVRAVTQQVGHAGLNAVWAQAVNLPTEAEITDPAAWVQRVHG